MGPLSAFCTALDKVFVIAGPTASGKSSFAQKLAREKKGIILNGDSLQVYRGLEILTAQPTIQDQKEIPHYLYGFLDPSENCSAGKWFPLVCSEIDKALTDGVTPIVVGGTGLYLKTLLEGISPIPSIDPKVRQDLLSQNRAQSSYYDDLQNIDPDLAMKINPEDKQRTLRGLEVFYGTGKPLSYWQSQKPQAPAYSFEKYLLMPSKEMLDSQISYRLEQMLEQGVLDEVKALLDKPLSTTAQKAIGLKEFSAYLNGKCSLEEALELARIHTRQYAKRQRTWFAHQYKADFVIN